MNRKLCILSILILSLFGMAVEAAQLDLKAQVNVTLPDVKLSDVVTSAQDMPEGALNMVVISAPALGQNRELTRQMVENALHSTLGNREITWSGATTCVINRPACLMSLEELTSIMEDQLKVATGGVGTIHVTELDETHPIVVPDVKTAPELEINPATMDAGWSSATLRFRQEGQTLLMKTMRFHWTWEQVVYQAARPLKSKENVDLGDFKPVTMNVFDLHGKAVMGKVDSGAYVLARALQPGAVLTEDCLQPRTLIHRGEIVKVIYKMSNFSVAMMGTALQDGAKGQTIGVMNPASNKQVLAKIADEGVLEYVH